MREIKFRAWDKVRKEFLSAGNIFIAINPGRNPKMSDIYLDIIKDPNSYKYRFIIQQYTGLKDKNGTEIYEGDILQGHGNKNDLSKVVYGNFPITDVETLTATDNVIGWHYEVIPTDTISKCEPFNIPMPLTEYYINRCGLEVIGNIYENPELLEVEQ